jgi:sugar lactone lactonase YvrE
MKYEIQLIADIGEELLEGPVFDKITNTLYFVSILECRVYRFLTSSKQLSFIQLDSPTSCVFISKQLGIVAAAISGFYRLDFDSRTFDKLFEIDLSHNLRFNDGILDARERFLIGTMGFPDIIENMGSLLCYSEGRLSTLVSGTTISNGIAFSEDSSRMYFIDTPTRAVKEYAYDIEKGTCDYIRDLIRFQGPGVPDGMDIDEKGNLWIAEWGGFCVSVWDSINGKNIGRVEIPSENVTSLCFDQSGSFYVTTAKSSVDGVSKGGYLFYVKMDKDEQ